MPADGPGGAEARGDGQASAAVQRRVRGVGADEKERGRRRRKWQRRRRGGRRFEPPRRRRGEGTPLRAATQAAAAEGHAARARARAGKAGPGAGRRRRRRRVRPRSRRRRRRKEPQHRVRGRTQGPGPRRSRRPSRGAARGARRRPRSRGDVADEGYPGAGALPSRRGARLEQRESRTRERLEVPLQGGSRRGVASHVESLRPGPRAGAHRGGALRRDARDPPGVFVQLRQGSGARAVALGVERRVRRVRRTNLSGPVADVTREHGRRGRVPARRRVAAQAGDEGAAARAPARLKGQPPMVVQRRAKTRRRSKRRGCVRRGGRAARGSVGGGARRARARGGEAHRRGDRLGVRRRARRRPFAPFAPFAFAVGGARRAGRRPRG